MRGMENDLRESEGTFLADIAWIGMSRPEMLKQKILADFLPEMLQEKLRALVAAGGKEARLRLDAALLRGQGTESLTSAEMRQGGVAVDNLQDMERAFAGVPLEKLALYIYAGAETGAFLALLAGLQAEREKSLAEVHGVIAADPLGALAEQGYLPLDLSDSYDELAQAVRWCEANMPHVRTILVRTAPYSDGGASVVQKLACQMETVREYIAELLARGISLEQLGRQMVLEFDVSADKDMLYLELSAAQKIWSQLMEDFGCVFTKMDMPVRLVPAQWNQTASDPHFLPHADAAARENGWYLDSMADELAAQAAEVMDNLNRCGGMAAAMSDGGLQRSIRHVYQERLAEIPCYRDFATQARVYIMTQEKEPAKKLLDTEQVKARQQQAAERFAAAVDHDNSTYMAERIWDVRRHCDPKLITVLQQAFQAGISLAEAIIVLHAGREELYGIEPIKKHFLVEYLRMRQN
jgi:methylmalonyl-CoA mutase N-terminal domain/subunit